MYLTRKTTKNVANNCDLKTFPVLPQIVPFSFGDEQINLDDSVMASCSIIKGDLPLRVYWQFFETDETLSYNLTTNDGVVVTKPSPKISILAIDAVKARHRGNYTCFAQNKAGVTQFSAYLAMNGSTMTLLENNVLVPPQTTILENFAI